MSLVLIVEDNPTNMKLASLLLTKGGHTVMCAIDAESGLALARSKLPDLILMDLQLPGMDGISATAILKRESATAAIPVIAVTALALKADEDQSRSAGCDAYIVKPLRYKELFAEIDAQLARARANKASPKPPVCSP